MKKILLLCFLACNSEVFSCSAHQQSVVDSSKQVDVFVKNFTDSIKDILFSNKTEKEKLSDLEKVFEVFLDCQYVKKMVTKDFIKKHGVSDNEKFNNAAFTYLLSRYVKITSDYNSATISNIKSKKIGREYVSTFDIIVKRGKVFKGKLFIDENQYKIKRAVINDIDLGDSKGICSKIERDFASDANKFIQYINNNF